MDNKGVMPFNIFSRFFVSTRYHCSCVEIENSYLRGKAYMKATEISDFLYLFKLKTEFSKNLFLNSY